MPEFGKFDYPDYTFAPRKKSELGIFIVKGKVGSVKFNIFKEFQYNVEVINDPPEFIGVEKFLGRV